MAQWTAPADRVIARLNGAEFLVCMEGVAGEQQTISRAREIYAALREPFQWRRERVAPSAAMGIAQADEGYAHPEELMRDADTAMTEAKSLGRGRLVCYSRGMRERAIARLKMEADLEQASRAGELVLYYLPEIDLATGTVAGFENTGSLAAPGARHHSARRVHSIGRRDRADPAAGRLGIDGGVPSGSGMEGAASRAAFTKSERKSIDKAIRQAGAGRPCGGGSGEDGG